jgi:hypothetical protein
MLFRLVDLVVSFTAGFALGFVLLLKFTSSIKRPFRTDSFSRTAFLCSVSKIFNYLVSLAPHFFLCPSGFC